jgi:hypothetical protein
MAPFRLHGDPLLHLVEGFWRPGESKTAENIRRPGRSEDRSCLQQDAVACVLDRKTRAGLPMQLLADRLGQDDLALFVETIVVSFSDAATLPLLSKAQVG